MRQLLLVTLAAVGCGSGGSGNPQFQIQFQPLVGGVPFSCTQTYSEIGTTNSTIAPLDFKMYVHDVNLVRADGSRVPLQLVQDGKWQLDNIAYLDFEDGSGTCMTGSPETNFTITGSAPAHSDYYALQFTLGLPSDYDHLDAAVAKAPLNQPAMWWSWVGGYRYFKLDVQSTGNPEWYFHLGAENCVQASSAGIDCKYSNLAVISTVNFVAGKSKIALDLKALYADSDLDASAAMKTTGIPGCMTAPGDTDCPTLFNKLGIAFENMGTPPTQTLFVAQ